MDKKKNHAIVSNAIFNVVRVGSNLLITLVTFPYISRVLGPEYLGKVNFATSVINYFVLLASLGIPLYGVIACSKVRDNKEELNKIVSELLILNIILMIISYGIFVVLAFSVERFADDRSVLLIMSLAIIFSAFGIEWLYTAHEEFAYISIRTIAFKVVTLVLFYILVKEQSDYIKYSWILTGSNVGTYLINFIHARKWIRECSIRNLNIKRHLRPVLLFFSASVASTINANTDAIMLGFIKGDTAVGLYEFSVKIKNLLTGIMTAGLSTLVPRFSMLAGASRFSEYRSLFRKSMLLILAVSLGITAFFIAFSTETIWILGGREYLQTKGTMRVLTSCLFPLAFTWSLGVGVLQPIGRISKYTKTMLIACGINVGLNALLIPFLSTMGAATATLATEISIALLFYYYAKDFIQEAFHSMKFLTLLFICLVSISVSRIICNLISTNVLVSIIIGFLIFGISYATLIKLLHKELWQLINKVIRSLFSKLRTISDI